MLGGLRSSPRSGRGVTPPDLLVGTVQDVVPGDQRQNPSIAVVRPGADPRTASTFFIVTAY